MHPYLLQGFTIDRPDKVWCSDVTLFKLKYGLTGFAYLTVVMDWFSSYVVSWELSMTMGKGFTIRCLNRALEASGPEIFNTDQSSQFTSNAFTGVLSDAGIRISMDSKSRTFDNIW
jgi:putative transposase